MSGKRLRVIAVLIIVMGLTACAAPQPREISTTLPEYVALPNGRNPFEPEKMAWGMEAYGGGLAAIEKMRGRRLNVLMISGGGKNGAFGAGVLNGWSETGKRPLFDLVTGISTGALQATFAFLGTPADNQTLKEIYTGVTNDDIYVKGGIGRVLGGGNSLMDTTPLRRLIEKYVTQEVVDRVAAEWDAGRFVLVGATNLDYDQLWLFNLSYLARHGGADRVAIYRKILLAAASPPVAFPPVEIFGHLFADGATLNNLIIAGLMGPTKEFVRTTRQQTGRMHVIHNGGMASEPEAVKAGIFPIAGKSVGLALEAQMATSIMRSYAVAAVHGYDWSMVDIPDDIEVGPNPLDFDPEDMRRLFEAGYALGLKPESWMTEPRPSEEVAPWLIDAVRKLRPNTP